MLGIEKATVKRTGTDSPACLDDASCEADCDAGTCGDAGECPDGGCEVDPDGAVDGDGMVDSDGGEVDAGDGGEAGDAGCAENSFRCEGNALSGRLQCVGGVWKTGAPCSNGALCDSQAATSGECKPVLETCLGRQPGQPFCVGAERKVCGPDLVSVTSITCPSRDHCSMATGAECAPCVSGEAKCEGDQLLLCNSALSGFEPKQLCNPGECKANLMRCSALVCDPDAYTCSPDNKLLHCNPGGTAYLSMEDCGSGVCDAQGKQCDKCKADDVLGCGDATNQSVCAPDGQGTINRSCASIDAMKPACTGIGQCVGCIPLTQSCQNNTTLLSCSGQGVSTPSTCTKTTCIGDRCTGECAPGEQVCTGTASPARKVCGPEGKYVAGTDCESGTLCDNGTPGGQCRSIAPGCATRMAGEAVCNGVTRSVCGPDRVTLTGSVDCVDAAHCQQASGAACAACLDNEHNCVGAELQVCNAAHTSFVSKKVCANAALCSVGAGDCTTQTCTPNEWYCNAGNLLQQCNETGTAYKPGTPCGSNICDKAGHQCDVCQPGVPVSCASGTQLNRCSADGQRLEAETCPSGTPVCTGAGVCRQCQPNVNTCSSSTTIDLCDGSGNKTSQSCAAHKTCYQGACRGECAPGEFRCPQQASTARDTCGPDGMFAATTACTSSQRCNRNTGNCESIVLGCSGQNPGDGVCIGSANNVRAVCGPDLVSYAGTNVTCSTANHCLQGSGGSCAFCTTNQYNCQGAQLQICNQQHTGWTSQGQPLCESATLCNTSAGMCTPATCTANAWSCEGPGKTSLQRCNGTADGWASIQQCTGAKPICDATGMQCDACNRNSLIGCASGTAQSFCANDGQGPGTPVVCPSQTPFCISPGNCVVCQPDDFQCNGAGDLEKCSGSGGWGLNRDCKANERCDKPSKTCISLAPFTLGRSDGGGAARPVANGTMYAVPVLIPNEPASLLLVDLGVVTDPSSNLGLAEIALYRDSEVSGSHRPGAIVDGTNSPTLSLPASSDGTRSRTGQPVFGVFLDPNTVYWIVVRIAELSSENTILVRHSTSGVTLPGGWVTTEVSASCGTNCASLPSAFPTSGPSPVNNTQLAAFINVRRI